MADLVDRQVAVAAVLDPSSLRAWLAASMTALEESRSAIDSLNVFPIADGDTGTNMFLTMEACYEALDDLPSGVTLGEAGAAVAKAATLGARGNSGVILAEILRGIVSTLDHVPAGSPLDIDIVRLALKSASDRAYKAVARPVEGTILTVARAAADAAALGVRVDSQHVEPDQGDLLRHLLGISSAMHAALRHTTEQLPVLRQAGVVDAGAQGLVVVYDALLDVVTGVRRNRPEVQSRVLPTPIGTETGREEQLEHGTGDFEVMFVCETDASTVDQLRAVLDSLGDSLVVTGGPDLWSVHVHVDDPGDAVERVIDLVRPRRLRITFLSAVELQSPPARLGRGILAVAHGPGIDHVLRENGVATIMAQPGRRPSTGEVLDAIYRLDASEVIVLPSDGDTIAVAEIAAEQARMSGVRASVIPTRSIVQTLAAVAVAEPGAVFDDVVVAMADAARATRYGAITVATKQALTSAGLCQVGDILGVVEGDIVEIGADEGVVVNRVLDRLLSTGGELVTFLTGEDVPPRLLRTVTEQLLGSYPAIDITVIEAGQPLWPLIIGVE
ncbi:MAG: DAK2 domain-containing protein [Candidatus Nanopelagicales bacterium]